ncbi:uncharacterized protein [Leptinotarsa decemlineata]|uniref:uncharacterized protein n=1 Tax=Leptinotarsa decemlineata TaxID=7539 RepID=UPI003D307D82
MNTMLKVVLILLLPGVLATQEAITLRNLENNPGLIPVKLGSAKVREFYHSIIHYYDLNPIITEINKLKTKSYNLEYLISKNAEYLKDTSNYLRILKFVEENAEKKLIEILPHPSRTKRGLINGLGSIFKAVTGNLDANDGERYENLIKQLQQNQNALTNNINTQNTLAISLIDKFNKTVQQINHNEEMLAEKINQISKIVQNHAYRENSNFIKDIMNQLINMFEMIISILQDIENSISFARIGIMHSSVMKTNELKRELESLEIKFKKNQLPIEISLENIPLIEKLIKIDCYILNNKITYILHVPITYSSELNLYHLYSTPIYTGGQFKAIVPRNKYLLKNELYYAFMSDACMKIRPQLYICEQADLFEAKKHQPL